MTFYNRFLLVLVFACCCSKALAQPIPPNSANPAPLPGLILIMAAGATYGTFKTYSKRQDKEDD
jgi:hypothetical protein